MSLTHLVVSHLRNLDQVDIHPSSDLNIVYGDNGSGKTSLLEAIHLLCRGNSFRSNSIRPIIQHQHSATTLFAELFRDEHTIPIGMERLLGGGGRIRIAGKSVTSLAELLSLIPIQFIGPDLQKVLEQGPKPRRNLLDWGVFHVEQHFYPIWMRYQKLLKQRNAALRKFSSRDIVSCWDHDLIVSAHKLTELRRTYLEEISMHLDDKITNLLRVDGVAFKFHQGWAEGKELEELLVESFESDRKRGYTQYGPQRADLLFTLDGKPVSDKLSRGQLKLLVVAFKLAQIEVLGAKRSDQRCVFLMDDLPAELDRTNRRLVIDTLLMCNAQVFVTTTDHELIDTDGLDTEKNKKVFHVEHGLVTEVI